MEKKNTFKIWLFIIFLLTIIIGGYFLMKKYMNLEPNNTTNVSKNSTSFNDIRKDTTKDYIYFTNDELFSEERDISFPNIVINFEDDADIEKVLNNTTEELKKENKYDDEGELIYAHYPVYSLYYYDNYISLVCDYYTYDSKEDVITYKNSLTYVFDKYSSELYISGRLLALFHLNVDEIKTKVKKFINDADLINGDVTLDTDASLAALSFDNLFVDKHGRLSIGIIVKSSETDYNDVVVLS